MRLIFTIHIELFFFLFKSFLFYLISIQFFITSKLKKKKKKRYIRLKFQRKQKKQKTPEGEKSEK